MLRGGILHNELNKVLASMGHGDILIVCDAGFPTREHFSQVLGRFVGANALADGEHGVWQCHSAYECTEACPQDVDPAGAIMALRRELIASKVKKLFGG